MSPLEVVDRIEQSLSQPLPDEVSAEELERQRRRRIAEENRAATERLAGLTNLEMGPRR